MLKKKLTELKDMFEQKNELVKFEKWLPIYDVIL